VDMRTLLNPDWAAMLSTPKYSAMSSYLTGWLGTVGNWLYVVTKTIHSQQGHSIDQLWRSTTHSRCRDVVS
jgi:hypothetical protein